MNKLGFLSILATVCTVTSVHASLNKNDLEKTIRSFNVEAVKQIIATETLSPMEHSRYLSLAEEMISERKFWVWRAGIEADHVNDMITPYHGPTRGDAASTTIFGYLIGSMSGICLGVNACYPELSNRTKMYLIAGTVFGTALFIKGLYDGKKCVQAEWEQRKLLRKKYDDAITIKQLICTTHIIGA